MKINTIKKIFPILLVIIIIVGGLFYWKSLQRCKAEIAAQPTINFDFETFSSNLYSFHHPNDYTITLPNKSFPVLMVEKKGRVEIFQMKDFGDRPFGFEGDEDEDEDLTSGDFDDYLPKERLTIGTGEKQYDVWLYYSKNDEQTKNELKTIFDSMLVK